MLACRYNNTNYTFANKHEFIEWNENGMILKIDKRKIGAIFLGLWYAFSYIQIMYLYDCTSWYRLLFWGARISLTIFTWDFYFSIRKNKNLNYLIVTGMGIFSFLLFVNTIYNCGKILNCCIFLLSLFTIIVFFDLLDKDDLQNCIRGVLFFFWILLIVQILSMILRPEGLYNHQMGRKYYFLGHVNYSGKMFVWGIALQAFMEKKSNRPMRKTFVYWLLSFAVVGVSKSYVSIVGIAFLGVLLYCSEWIKVSSKWMLLENAIISLILVVIHSLANNLQHLVTALSTIGRMSSLTVRLSIWEQGLKTALKSIIGHGYVDDYSKYIRYGNYVPSSAHNLNIDLLISVGLLGFVAFCIYLFALVRNAESNKNAYPMLCTALVCAFMWNFEPYLSSSVFLLLNSGLVILYNVKTKVEPIINLNMNC